jgi:hypothetical protein
MLSPGRAKCELGRIAEELWLPLDEDCSPPAQETRLGTLGSARSALPLIKDKPGLHTILGPGHSAARCPPAVVMRHVRKGEQGAYHWN